MLLVVAILLIFLTMFFSDKFGSSWASYGAGFFIAIAVILIAVEIFANEALRTIGVVVMVVAMIACVIWGAFFNNKTTWESASAPDPSSESTGTPSGAATCPTSSEPLVQRESPQDQPVPEEQDNTDLAIQAAGIYTIGLILLMVALGTDSLGDSDAFLLLNAVLAAAAVAYYFIAKQARKAS